MRNTTVLNVHGYISRKTRKRDSWKWIAEKADKHLTWKFLSMSNYPLLNRIPRPCLSRYITAWLAAWNGRKVDIVVTHGEKIAIWTGLFLRLLGSKPLFIAWGFTSPEYKKYSRLKTAFMQFALAHINHFIVFSEIEKTNYPTWLGLPEDRFNMIPWSVAKPEIDPSVPAIEPGDYIAAIGGEGRDYATLFKAMEDLPDIRLVVVGSVSSLEGLKAPDNVTLHVEIPFDDAINIARHSQYMVLPLYDSKVPCGHGSLITQFNLGKATIITESDAMKGYVSADVNTLTYPAGDAEQLRDKIQTLYSNAKLRQAIASAGEKFATQYCSEKFTVEYFNSYVEKQFRNRENMDDPALIR